VGSPAASPTITATTTTTTAEVGEGRESGAMLMQGPEGSVEVSAGVGVGVGERRVGGVTSRFLGLVVVPGEVIVKVEVEERRGGLSGLRGGIV